MELLFPPPSHKSPLAPLSRIEWSGDLQTLKTCLRRRPQGIHIGIRKERGGGGDIITPFSFPSSSYSYTWWRRIEEGIAVRSGTTRKGRRGKSLLLCSRERGECVCLVICPGSNEGVSTVVVLRCVQYFGSVVVALNIMRKWK